METIYLQIWQMGEQRQCRAPDKCQPENGMPADSTSIEIAAKASYTNQEDS